jgi:hypothetical protein
LTPPSFLSEDINHTCEVLLEALQRAIGDPYRNNSFTVLDAISNLIYSIDDYHLTLPDGVTISLNDWHWFTHLMFEASQLWDLMLSGR